jgi:hypothetical protein
LEPGRTECRWRSRVGYAEQVLTESKSRTEMNGNERKWTERWCLYLRLGFFEC